MFLISLIKHFSRADLVLIYSGLKRTAVFISEDVLTDFLSLSP